MYKGAPAQGKGAVAPSLSQVPRYPNVQDAHLRCDCSNKEELTLERLREAAVVVIAAPREKFSKAEVSSL
jgi:hypothetical protein